MSILCYVTFNDGGSVLKGVSGEWGPMFSPESPALARSAASQWGPRPPVRTQRQHTAQLSALTPNPPPPPSPPLAPQISSSRLNRFFYFISLSSGEQPRPPPSGCLTLKPTAQPHPLQHRQGPSVKLSISTFDFYALSICYCIFELPTTTTTTKEEFWILKSVKH